VLCPRIDPLRFLGGCCKRRLNQGLVVALDFFSLLDRVCFCVIFSVYGCMLCLVRCLFVISTSVIDCLGRFVPEMTCYVSSGTLNLTQLNSTLVCVHLVHRPCHHYRHQVQPDSEFSLFVNLSCEKICSRLSLAGACHWTLSSGN